MNKKQEEQSKKIKELGMKKYILKYGILRWGITTGLLWSVLMHFLQPEEKWYVRPIIALILFPIGGVFLGYLHGLLMKKLITLRELNKRHITAGIDNDIKGN